MIPRLALSSARHGSFDVHYATCGMGTIAATLAAGLEVRYDTTVTEVVQDRYGVTVTTTGRGKHSSSLRCNSVVLATTADVASAIWPDAPAPVRTMLGAIRYSTLEGVYFTTDIPLERRTPDGRLISQTAIKPAHRGPDGFTGLIYQNQYANRGGLIAVGRPVTDEPDAVLLDKAASLVRRMHPDFSGKLLDSVLFRRHRYVPIIEPGYIRRLAAAQGCLPAGRITLAGDYLRYPLIEGAVRSGFAAAEQNAAATGS